LKNKNLEASLHTGPGGTRGRAGAFLRGSQAAIGFALMAMAIATGCGDLLGPNIEGLWDYKSYSSKYSGTESGTIDFKSDGTFEVDATNTGTGHRKGGGDYTHKEAVNGGKTLRMHFTWAEYDGGSKQEFDGYTFSGDVTSGSGTYTLEEETANIWTIEISR